MHRNARQQWHWFAASLVASRETLLFIRQSDLWDARIIRLQFHAIAGAFVIIRSRGTDAYNPYVYAMGGDTSFDIRNWASYQGGTVNYSISAINGVLTSSQADRSTKTKLCQGPGACDAIVENPCVGGSIPPRATKNKKKTPPQGGVFFY